MIMSWLVYTGFGFFLVAAVLGLIGGVKGAVLKGKGFMKPTIVPDERIHKEIWPYMKWALWATLAGFACMGVVVFSQS